MSRIISAASGSGDVVGPGSSTDNAITRFDGTTGKLIQNSTGILSDTGVLTGLSEIQLGGIVWNAAGEYFNNATGAMSFSTTGAFDMNFTPGIGGNLNFLAGAGGSQVNIAADGDCTFGSFSGFFLLNAGTNVNINANSGTMGLDATGGIFSYDHFHVAEEKELRLVEALANGTNYVAIKAPAALTANYTLTMPGDDGAANQALFTNGSGTLSWQTTPTITAGTDNQLMRYDGTLAAQGSLGVLDDSGNLTGLNSIVLTDTTFATNSISSLNNLDITGAVDLTATATAGNLNLVAGTGIGFTAPGGIFHNNDTTFQASAIHGANTIFLGAANDAGIFRDGTSLVINPRLVGSVSVNDVVIGSSSASAGNDSNLRCFRLGIYGSDIGSTAGINCVVTGGLRSALNFVLTGNTSGAVAAPLVCNYIDQGTGTAIISTSTFEYTLQTTTHTQTNATQASVVNISSGIAAATTLSPVGTAENHMFTCLKLAPNGKGVGGAHSNGASTLNIFSTGLYQKKMTAFTGTGTYTYVGAYFGDDVCLQEETKLIFNNTATDSTAWVKPVKGNYYYAYSIGNTAIEHYANGVNVFSQTATLNTSQVILRTLSGTSTSYARVGGTINVNTTAVGNVGAGEDDLITYTVPANTLSTNGDHIEFKVSGTFAANANTKRIRVKFGATTLLDTTALAFNGVDWSAEGTIVRTGATTQKAYCAFRAGATLTSTSDDTAPGETLSASSVFKVTGEATSNNDIVETFHTLKWFPNA